MVHFEHYIRDLKQYLRNIKQNIRSLEQNIRDRSFEQNIRNSNKIIKNTTCHLTIVNTLALQHTGNYQQRMRLLRQ